MSSERTVVFLVFSLHLLISGVPPLTLFTWTCIEEKLILCPCGLQYKQEDEAALLEQALAMSMDGGKAKNVDIADADMSEATAEDPELAYG